MHRLQSIEDKQPNLEMVKTYKFMLPLRNEKNGNAQNDKKQLNKKYYCPNSETIR